MLMFFKTTDTIPEGLGFQAFGTLHLLWLLAGLFLWVTGCLVYRKLSEPERQAVLRYFASLAQTPEPAPPQNRSVK